ncbi:MAG: peptidoglycan DD-metalloendopeptidase family protein [Anaerolineae bacterium]
MSTKLSDARSLSSIPFVPRRLFVNRLNDGFYEVSAYVRLDVEDGERPDHIEWETADPHSGYQMRSRTPVSAQATGPSIPVRIVAVLPPSWKRGTLTVHAPSAGPSLRYSIAIEQFSHQRAFILPLAGYALTAMGHRIGEAHRAALEIPSQQFGWDFLGLGADGLSIVHLPTQGSLCASDFPGFGSDVIAPADGRVCAARDDQQDAWEAGRLPQDVKAYQADLTLALGNYVILDHGDGIWSVMAHLKEGSLQVTVGQDVIVGEVLGSLGNSGSSSGPHIHFHFMDGPDILTASPLPVMLTLEDGVFAPQAGDIVSNS